MTPPAPWRVVIISQIPQVATRYAALVRAFGHTPVAHVAVRSLRDDDRPNPSAGSLLESVPADVDLLFPAKRASLAPLLRAYDADLALCTAFPWLIPADAIAVPPLGIVNGHPSRLPAHRGPIPMAWAVREGETEIGLSYHLMDAAFDTGPLLAQGAVPLAEDETLATLSAKLGELAAELLPIVFDRLARGDGGDPQPAGGSYQSLFEADYRWIDLGATAADAHRQVRAWRLSPGDADAGALISLDGRRTRVIRSSLTEVHGARRLDLADGPLWLVETESA